MQTARRLIARHAQGAVHDALADTRVVAFKAGALLYTGANIIPFGDRLAAVPISGLWVEASA